MLVLTNGRFATMKAKTDGYGLIAQGATVIRDGRIVWVGDEQALPAGQPERPARGFSRLRSGFSPRASTMLPLGG